MKTKTNINARDLAEKKITELLGAGFSNFPILIIGERGIGKSKMVKKAAGEKNVVVVNCASFTDDAMAESALFGHVKGAFTGAATNRKGYFHEANGGILFLDEIHHLSKRCQAKLNVALQMENDQYKNVRKLGSTKTEDPMSFKVIAATNITDINKLYGEYLFPDFYDRIAHNIIEIPSLRDTPEHIESDWQSNWENLKFYEDEKVAISNADKIKLMAWLKDEPLYGNFRDLQKIAIAYVRFFKYTPKLQKMLPEKNALEYAKNQFDKYKSPQPETETNGVELRLSFEKNASELQKDFNFELQKWAIDKYGRDGAAKKLGVSERTLNNWKNRV